MYLQLVSIRFFVGILKVRGMDPRIRIRTKMSWIPNTATEEEMDKKIFFNGEYGTGTVKSRYGMVDWLYDMN
jgi:hypothetical protein